MQDPHAIDLAVAGAGERLLHDDVGLQHAGDLAAAVEAEVERVERIDPAAVDDAGAAAAQVAFAGRQQILSKAGVVATALDHQQVGRAQAEVNRRFVVGRAKPGVGKADRDVVPRRDDQPGRVEMHF